MCLKSLDVFKGKITCNAYLKNKLNGYRYTEIPTDLKIMEI